MGGTLIAVPTLGSRINSSLANWLCQSPHSKVFVEGASPVEFARNLIVETFLKGDADVLWMVDDDMIPYPGCEKILEGVFDVNVAPCRMWKDDVLQHNFTYHEGKFLGGCGSMAVRRKVFESDKMLTANGGWFCPVRRRFGQVQVSEDYAFCIKAQECGFTVGLVEGSAMGHIKPVDLNKVWLPPMPGAL